MRQTQNYNLINALTSILVGSLRTSASVSSVCCEISPEPVLVAVSTTESYFVRLESYA